MTYFSTGKHLKERFPTDLCTAQYFRRTPCLTRLSLWSYRIHLCTLDFTFKHSSRFVSHTETQTTLCGLRSILSQAVYHFLSAFKPFVYFFLHFVFSVGSHVLENGTFSGLTTCLQRICDTLAFFVLHNCCYILILRYIHVILCSISIKLGQKNGSKKSYISQLASFIRPSLHAKCCMLPNLLQYAS